MKKLFALLTFCGFMSFGHSAFAICEATLDPIETAINTLACEVYEFYDSQMDPAVGASVQDKLSDLNSLWAILSVNGYYQTPTVGVSGSFNIASGDMTTTITGSQSDVEDAVDDYEAIASTHYLISMGSDPVAGYVAHVGAGWSASTITSNTSAIPAANLFLLNPHGIFPGGGGQP